MSFIVVAYYTKNTGYEEEVKHLVASLDNHKLKRDISGIESQGDWQANTHFKPYFIKQMLTKHFPSNLLYLDADARVEQHPKLLDSASYDIGVHYKDNKELLGSMLYLRNNGKIFELIERWITCCFAQPQIWDQKILQYVIQESEDLNLIIEHLPATYCQIFDLMRSAGEPVIQQFQASRRFKKS